MHCIRAKGRLFEQIPVSQRERVRIHHHGSRAFPRRVAAPECTQVIRKAGAPVFHKDKFVRDTGNLIEPQV